MNQNFNDVTHLPRIMQQKTEQIHGYALLVGKGIICFEETHF